MTQPLAGPEQKRSWSSFPALFELLAVPITARRMDLVWRLLGFVFVLLWLQHMDEDSVFEFVDKSAAALDGVGLFGLALLIAGPSLIVLLGGALVGVAFLAAVLRREPTLEFVADEYVVQAGIPIVTLLLTVIFVGKAVVRTGPRVDAVLRDQVDEIHARVVRIFTVTTLAFAGIHKLNADFFAAESCANLGNRLHAWWALPFDAPTAGPVEIVTLELLAAIMLVVYPRVGILLVVYTMAGLGHIGPTAFASTCMVMSLAFLDRGDIPLLRRFFARRWGVVVAAAVIVTASSFSTYHAPLPWLKYGLLELVIVVVVSIAVGTGVMRLRQRSTHKRRMQPAALRWWRRPATAMPGLASWLTLLLVVNGLTPYFGVKYRFSVAMLSNLRVDQERWNSYVFPRWMSLRKQTPQVVVDWQPYGKWATPKTKNGQYYLGDGLFSADALRSALRDASLRHASGELTMTYLDETVTFELPTDMLTANAWAERLPSSPLWQDRLGPGDEPQSCVH